MQCKNDIGTCILVSLRNPFWMFTECLQKKLHMSLITLVPFSSLSLCNPIFALPFPAQRRMLVLFWFWFALPLPFFLFILFFFLTADFFIFIPTKCTENNLDYKLDVWTILLLQVMNLSISKTCFIWECCNHQNMVPSSAQTWSIEIICV